MKSAPVESEGTAPCESAELWDSEVFASDVGDVLYLLYARCTALFPTVDALVDCLLRLRQAPFWITHLVCASPTAFDEVCARLVGDDAHSTTAGTTASAAAAPNTSTAGAASTTIAIAPGVTLRRLSSVTEQRSKPPADGGAGGSFGSLGAAGAIVSPTSALMSPDSDSAGVGVAVGGGGGVWQWLLQARVEALRSLCALQPSQISHIRSLCVSFLLFHLKFNRPADILRPADRTSRNTPKNFNIVYLEFRNLIIFFNFE